VAPSGAESAATIEIDWGSSDGFVNSFSFDVSVDEVLLEVEPRAERS